MERFFCTPKSVSFRNETSVLNCASYGGNACGATSRVERREGIFREIGGEGCGEALLLVYGGNGANYTQKDQNKDSFARYQMLLMLSDSDQDFKGLDFTSQGG